MSGSIDSMRTVRLTADTSLVQAMTAELAKLTSNAPDAFVERLLGIVDGGESLFCVDGHTASASDPHELAVTVKPTEFMNRLMATARAGNFDLAVFDPEHERPAHGQ